MSRILIKPEDLDLNFGELNLDVINSKKGSKYIYLNQRTKTVEVRFDNIEEDKDSREVIKLNEYSDSLELDEIKQLVYRGLSCYYCPYQDRDFCLKQKECSRLNNAAKYIPLNFRTKKACDDGKGNCYYTENQLKKQRRVPLNGAQSVFIYNNGFHDCGYIYYLYKDTRSMTSEELKAYENEKRKKNRERYQKYKRKKEREKKKEVAHRKYNYYLSYRRDLTNCTEKIVNALKDKDCSIVVYDLETTGLKPGINAILELALINVRTGEILFHSHFKPEEIYQWNKKASEINKISPKDVENKPSLKEMKEEIQKILDKTDILVGYNNQNFEDFFLTGEGFKLPRNNFDLMHAFAPIYGEWNEYYDDFKWPSLQNACHYYGIVQDHSHTALDDAEATRLIFLSMFDEKRKTKKIG